MCEVAANDCEQSTGDYWVNAERHRTLFTDYFTTFPDGSDRTLSGCVPSSSLGPSVDVIFPLSFGVVRGGVGGGSG